MSTLTLPMKRQYFDEIKAGTKTVEYRLYNNYWKKRISNKNFDNIELTLGYPERSDASRRITKPWRGFWVETITHPQFGDTPVKVFAIDLRG